MILTRPLCSIDIECTTVDPTTARIIEFGMYFLYPDGTRKGGARRFNPGCPIPPESTAVHGITDADVADLPPFDDFAPKIVQSLRGKDILGFNLRRLDLPLLDESLRRAGLKLELTPDQRIVDCYAIFSKKESRTLSDAVLKYTGKPHDGAHGAGEDANATIDVLLGQLAMYEDLATMELEELSTFSRMSELEYLDFAGKLYRDKDGDACYSFGKDRDKKVRQSPGYGRWMMGASFAGNTLDCLRAEFERLGL